MATKIGPKTVTQRDRSKALVFCIDAANSRSYGGEPTTNLAPPDLANWDDSGTSVRTAAGYTFQGQPVYKCRTQLAASWIGIDKTISGLRTAASGSTVCMSIWVKNPNPSGYTFSAYIGHDFSSARVLAANSGWQKIEWTVAVGSMANDYVEYRPYTNSADRYIHMTMPQVEVKAVSTPFTATSRTTTTAITNISGVGAQGTTLTGTFATYGQSLFKPTTRNVLATIDPNQGHIGGAYWDLDGSDEYIALGASSQFGITEAVSCVAWIKLNNLSGWGGVFGATTGGAFIHFQMYLGGVNCYLYGPNPSYGAADAGSYVTAGEWAHIGFAFGDDLLRVYVDGEQMPTTVAGNGNPVTTTSDVSIGRVYSSSRMLDGAIANLMVWSAALTAKEIKDIYIAQKGRFGK